MWQKILVALDRSSLSPAIFEQALETAQTMGSRLMLIHVLEWEHEKQYGHSYPYVGVALGETYESFPQIVQQRLEEERETVRDWLRNYSQQATARGVVAEYDCVLGQPSQGIIDTARSWNANLIVLGRRGRQGLTEMLLGSVSNTVVHHAPCSVLVVQGISSPDGEATRAVANQEATD
ncbi:MAG: universal stress protein [Cyanophyceae cyanobacterium]